MGGRRSAVVVFLAACALIVSAVPAGAATSGWHRSLVPGGDPTSFEGLAAIPGGQVWAVGGLGGGVNYDTPTAWRRGSGGWQAFAMPVDLTGRWGYLQAVAGSSADDVWAVGQTTIRSNGEPQPLVAHWDGTAWNVITQPFIAPGEYGLFTSVATSSPTDVWVGGLSYNGVDEPLLWHFTGVFWTQVPVPVRNRTCSPGDATITALAESGSDLYVALRCRTAATRDAGLVMRYDGRRWNGALKLKAGGTVAALATAPDGTVWAAGTVNDGSSVHAAVWSGGAGGLAAVPTSAIAATTADAIATGPGGEVIVVGEHQLLPGPAPFVMSMVGGVWGNETVPFDRQLSAAAVASTGRVFIAGPTFGGWIGGTGSHASVLARAAG